MVGLRQSAGDAFYQYLALVTDTVYAGIGAHHEHVHIADSALDKRRLAVSQVELPHADERVGVAERANLVQARHEAIVPVPQRQRIVRTDILDVDHAHIGVLGFAGVTALGGLYFILPKITGKPLYSKFLADVQYWLVLIGVTGFAVVLTVVGLIQGNAWYNGETLYRTLPMIQPYYILRASLGTFIMIGAYIGLYNIIRSLYFNRGAAK